MPRNLISLLVALLAVVWQGPPIWAGGKTLRSREPVDSSSFWRAPEDILSRDLFYGPGGEKDQPHGPFVFLKEDMDGTNPKFSVRDRDGVKWKVKLGVEARPETAATRLVWAVGYFADEDYFLADLKVEKMGRLKRGRRLVAADGSMHSVRLKREPKEEKKTGSWEWRDDPFAGTRPWNGLRVMMALLNNWDVKDENNKVREIDGSRIYEVSDLGASFGKTGYGLTSKDSKDNLKAYLHSRFITRVTREYVNLGTPSRPALDHLLFTPPEYFWRIHLEWIGKRIPVADARWIGALLARLSDGQVQSAFRAAGYRPAEVQSLSTVVEKRIAELNQL